MATEERQTDTSVRERLYRSFHGFSFFRAVDLLERFSHGAKPLGRTLIPSEEPVRFSVRPGLAFPASDISDLREKPGNAPAEMAVAFMGLLGPSGVLPHWYNELALERAKKRDTGFAAFLDIFHHRLVTLFYLAWKKHRFPENYLAGAGDRLSGYLLSLAGLGTGGMVGRLGVPREALAFYCGLLSLPTASALGIEAAVEYFTGTRARVEQFIEQEVLLEPGDLTAVGLRNGLLGVDAVCGDRIRECQSRFRVLLGPVPLGTFRRMLPTGDLLFPIFSFIRYRAGMEFEFDIRIALNKAEVPRGVLGTASCLLGWSSWIAAGEHTFPDDPHVTFRGVDLARTGAAGAPPRPGPGKRAA
jgi:type VI secretion system protein ImpH